LHHYNYVFDGSKKEPYLEIDPVSPLGVYGKSKAEGKAKVRRILKEHIIIRTAWLYGIHGNNFVKTMLRLGKEKETLRIVSDQYGCPTYAGDLAGAILTIAAQIGKKDDIVWGTYHYCGKGKTTWYGFAEKIFDLVREHRSLMLKKVVPITTAEYPTQAKKPANSVLDCSLITKTFGFHQRLASVQNRGSTAYCMSLRLSWRQIGCEVAIYSIKMIMLVLSGCILTESLEL
jgi:dTDP-4-dehydrorhamnose reductase